MGKKSGSQLKATAKAKGSGGGCLKSCGIFVLLLALGVAGLVKYSGFSFDVLNGLDSGTHYSNMQLQVMVGAFCMSPLVSQLLANQMSQTNVENFSLEEHGHIEEEDYQQDSIYAILYAMYKNAPELVSEHGVKYQFTFNTWGISNSEEAANGPSPIKFEPFPPTDPQRHGKHAYRGLVVQPPVLDYIAKLPKDQKLQIVEVGCGTGAGANLITREVHPNSEYLALDMQQAAINTCKSIHATPDNPGLNCMRIPNGVGINGGKIPKDDNSVDIVVISETHIAEERIGDLEKSIFAEIRRVLKPGGFFVWGNALPTLVWQQGDAYLPTAGFEQAYSTNHTKGAVIARDEDFARVELALKQLVEPYHVMKLPYFGDRCNLVANRLIANFYRHPGTGMYLRMVTGTDSYMHQAWRVVK